MKRGDCRGQMKLSFGMIFSIFLIIIFLTFAFFAITKFMKIGSTAQIGSFKNSLQQDIDKMWKGSQGSDEFHYNLPSGIEYVCFMDYETDASGPKADFREEFNSVYFGGENLFFYPVGSAEGLDSTEIKHVDMAELTGNENPYCVRIIDGRMNIRLTKNYGENLVQLQRIS